MRRHLIALIAFSLLAAACGQYPGVHEEVWGEGGAAALDPTALAGGEVPDGDTTAVPDGTTEAGDTGGGTGTGTGTTGGGTGTGTGGGGGGGGDASDRPRIGSDSTGITSSTITVGLHAPLTGAAPLKQTSFETGRELYWRHGNNGDPVLIYGRTVRVIFRDDQYNPSYARTVCQEMAEQENAFLLIGGGGTDQTQACAQYAASKGIPYFSAGVTELGLSQLPNYFAGSMTYPDQVPLMADYIRKQFKPAPSRIAAVITDTSNFDDAADAFVQEFPQARVFRPGKSDPATAMAEELCDENGQKVYDVVFPLTSPSYYYQLASLTACKPQYVGVGITMGLDSVADLGCRSNDSTENARFFSPAPAFENSDQFDKQFRAAGGSDDIQWLLWGLSKTLHQLFQNAGPELTREGFIYYSSRTSVSTGVFPALQYTPEDRFGADQVHLLRNVCQRRGNQSGYYVTEAAFKSSF